MASLTQLRIVRRLGVITVAGGRQRWSAAEKARITEATMAPGTVVPEIARYPRMSPQHLFTWRREARQAARLLIPMIVPAVIKRPIEEPEIDGVAVRVQADASPRRSRP